jgi:hypothetical protein
MSRARRPSAASADRCRTRFMAVSVGMSPDTLKQPLAPRVPAPPLDRPASSPTAPAMDSTGIHALRELARNGHRSKTQIILAEVLEQPRTVLGNSGLLDEIGVNNVFDSLDDALERAREIAGTHPAPDDRHACGRHSGRAAMTLRGVTSRRAGGAATASSLRPPACIQHG